jgi:hypothetical protein
MALANTTHSVPVKMGIRDRDISRTLTINHSFLLSRSTYTRKGENGDNVGWKWGWSRMEMGTE